MRQARKIVLVGSGEFTEAMVEIDREVLVGQGPVAIVPTAAGQEADWWKWVEDGVRHFGKLGIEAYGVPVRNREDAQRETVGRARAVYFSGGDPGYLVETMKNTKMWEEIQTKEIIVGSSAGAMLLGQWVLANIYPVFEKGEKNLQWVRAIGIVPYTVWPHFDFVLREMGEKWEWLKAQMPEEVKKTSIGIDENTAVVIEEGKELMVKGGGKVTWNTLEN